MESSEKFYYNAVIKWYPLGIGRKCNYPDIGVRYAPIIKISKSNSCWSIVFQITPINNDNESNIVFEFLADDYPHNIIDTGDSFYICEGSETVAEGVVTYISIKKEQIV